MTRISPICQAALLRAARACAKARGVPLRTISWRAHGDASFLDRLSRGRCSCTIRKFDDIMEWLEDPANWPEGQVSPDVVDPFAGIAP